MVPGQVHSHGQRFGEGLLGGWKGLARMRSTEVNCCSCLWRRAAGQVPWQSHGLVQGHGREGRGETPGPFARPILNFPTQSAGVVTIPMESLSLVRNPALAGGQRAK